MARFRRRLLGIPEAPEAAGEFDLVVAGGGIAGTCAAVSARILYLVQRPLATMDGCVASSPQACTW